MWAFGNPVNVRFGVGSLSELAKLINKRPYALVTYPDAVFDRLRDSVAGVAGKPALVINNVKPNPDFHSVSDGCALWAASSVKPEVIVALGGGSVIDTAKGLAAADGDFATVRSYLETGRGVERLASVPIIAVPTTAGTGSEVTMWATIWDTDAQKKYSLARPNLYPEHALVDPSLMVGMPRALTISTGLDALSHSLESIWNRNSNPISSTFAISAASEILKSLPAAVASPDNVDLRSRVAQAALFAGLAFSNTKTAIAHSISYPLTLTHNVPHGVACSFTLPAILRSVIGSSEQSDDALKRIFGSNLSTGADQLERLLEALDIALDPAAYGVGASEWGQIVDDALDGERGKNFLGSREKIFQIFGLAKAA